MGITVQIVQDQQNFQLVLSLVGLVMTQLKEKNVMMEILIMMMAVMKTVMLKPFIHAPLLKACFQFVLLYVEMVHILQTQMKNVMMEIQTTGTDVVLYVL